MRGDQGGDGGAGGAGVGQKRRVGEGRMLSVVRVHLPSEIPIVGYGITSYELLCLPNNVISTNNLLEDAPVDGHFMWYRCVHNVLIPEVSIAYGDMRKALGACRNAIEVFEARLQESSDQEFGVGAPEAC
ncbi:hypothetical protein GUJ93_ZPchr0015g6753 [Zizania palustris]|uniref:Uncharacterized protein n=1 Tax=Zizania palustris TaxID=103762 RepID=A0A8J5TI52_ZIZPA|nr:hypothetical protein GUJ93_ZPchr0015g6753 [Zizania palustris]